MVRTSRSVTLETRGAGFVARLCFPDVPQGRGPWSSSKISEWDAIAHLVRTSQDRFGLVVNVDGRPGDVTVSIEGIDDSATGTYLDEALALLIERQYVALGITIERVAASSSLPLIVAPSGSFGLGLVPILTGA